MVLGGCGRIGFDAQGVSARDAAADDASAEDIVDAGARDDAATPTCTFGPWSAPARLTILNTSDDDWGAALSPDRLTMYFESDRPPDPALWKTSRTSAGATWQPATRVATLDSPGAFESNPTITRDGLTLYFTADRVTPNTFNLYRATRADLVSEFAGDSIVAELAGETVLGPALSSDGTELIFTNSFNNARFRRSILKEGVFGPSSFIEDLNTMQGDGWGSFGDDLTLIFASERGSDADLYLATRALVGGPWSPASAVDELNQDGFDEYDPEFSADMLEVIFSSNRPGGAGGFDLFSSTRVCE